jgi:predicted dehydrogenase
MSNPKTARLGIVGGGIRGHMFARATRERASAELVAICDKSAEVRQDAMRDFGVPAYAEVNQMLAAHPELTAAVIATPDFAHREVAVACAQQGLDLLVEKPLATTVADAEAIIAAAHEVGGRIMVGFENRWNPRFLTVKRLLGTEASGPVVAQQVSLNDTIYVPTRMLSWAAKSSPAWFLMPHTLDLAMWLSGASPRSVHATGRKGILQARGVDTWDSITATFQLTDGSYVVLNSSWILPETAPAVYDFRYEVQTSEAAFHIDGANHGVTHYGADGVRWPQSAVYERNSRIAGVPIDMMNDFITFVEDGSVAVPGPEAGLAVTRALAAVDHSLATGEVIMLA